MPCRDGCSAFYQDPFKTLKYVNNVSPILPIELTEHQSYLFIA